MYIKISYDDGGLNKAVQKCNDILLVHYITDIVISIKIGCSSSADDGNFKMTLH